MLLRVPPLTQDFAATTIELGETQGCEATRVAGRLLHVLAAVDRDVRACYERGLF